MTVTLKTCTKCGIEKGLLMFSKNKMSKDGLNSWCKDCYKIYSSRRYAENKTNNKEYRLKNHDKKIEQDRIYREKNRDILRLKYPDQGRRYRARYPERIRKKQKNEWDNLIDWRVKKALIRSGFIASDITPELIELERIIIKTKRLCKTSKN